MKLKRSFFSRPVLAVAPDLLGKFLIRQVADTKIIGQIFEVEAYGGSDDLASHASRRKTARNKIMWDKAGLAYVYRIYGLHTCFNVTTDEISIPGAVLIRAVLMRDEAGNQLLIDGPGKVCRVFGITLDMYGVDCINSTELYFSENKKKPEYLQLPRVGITKATDLLWRFRVNSPVSDRL